MTTHLQPGLMFVSQLWFGKFIHFASVTSRQVGSYPLSSITATPHASGSRHPTLITAVLVHLFGQDNDGFIAYSASQALYLPTCFVFPDQSRAPFNKWSLIWSGASNLKSVSLSKFPMNPSTWTT